MVTDDEKARRRREERKKLLERLNSYGEGAPNIHGREESEHELECMREIERGRRPEPGIAGGGA